MNDLYSLNIKVMAFDSEDPREQNCFVWTVSLNQGEQKRLPLARLPAFLRSWRLSSARQCWYRPVLLSCRVEPMVCIQGTSAYRSLATPSHTMHTPHTLSGGHRFCSLACQGSCRLLRRQIELGSAHTYQSYNIWEGVETLGFFGLTWESGNKKHPHRRFVSGKQGRSLYSFSLPLTPLTFLPF